MATVIDIKNIPVGYQSIISNGKHSILADEPTKSKGTDLGMSPPELVLAGLAMCKVGTVRYIARKKGWEVGNVDGKLEQTVKRSQDGALTPHVKVHISIEGDLSEEQKKELLYEADHCYVHRLIEGDWQIEASIEQEELELVHP